MQDMPQMWVRSPGREDPLGQPIPVFLPGESPWTEEPGRVESMGAGVTKSWAQFSRHTHTHTQIAYNFSISGLSLALESASF